MLAADGVGGRLREVAPAGVETSLSGEGLRDGVGGLEVVVVAFDGV